MSNKDRVRRRQARDAVANSWRLTWRSLHNRNLRVYLAGHMLSRTGGTIQQTAELWLLLELTGSGTAVGFHSVLRFGPLLVFGAYAGVLADRFQRLRLLLNTQAILLVSATVLAVAAWIGEPAVALIYTVAAVQGVVLAIDNPLRRSFVRDLASDDELTNAVSLLSSAGTVARTAGPAIAGVLIAIVGVAVCFALNAISFALYLVGLLRLDRARMRPQVLLGSAPRQLREGLLYAWHHRSIRLTLILCAVVSIFGWNWDVLIPFLAIVEFDGGAPLYGTLLSVLGVGSMIGTLAVARATRVRAAMLLVLGAFLAGALMLVAVAPVLLLAGLGLALAGGFGSAFVTAAQARLQLAVDDHMSGRVLALYSMVFMGTKPIGAMLAGFLVEIANARLGFAVGGVVIGLTVAAVWWRRLRPMQDDRPRPEARVLGDSSYGT